VAPEDCSALYDTRVQADTGDVEREDGCEAPLIWCPAESDFPNRYAHRSYQGGWFWREGEEDTVLPADELFGCYLTSVGRNTNMLVGMVIDTDGRFPDTDAAVFAETGERIRRVFGAPIAVGKDGETELILPEDPAAPPAYAVLREDITMGERVTGYTLRAYDREGNEIFSHNGKVISHKRILKIPAATARVKLEVTDSRDDPVLLPLEICSEG
jgi:alpha-L-fucosidase